MVRGEDLAHSKRMRNLRPLATSCLLALLALSGACGPKQGEGPAPTPTPAPAASGDAPAAGACAVDADCVPASCCHPDSCVPAAQQPGCTDEMCTMECRPGTLDCGGRCACEQGSCKAILGQP